MGTFAVNVEVAKPTNKPTFVRVNKILVDTGSEMTWISGDTLRELRIDMRKKDQPFIMANGQQITRDIGYAIIRCGEFETIDEVVFAQPGDLQLLGARTLEGFNAVIDPRRKHLVAAGPMPAARMGCSEIDRQDSIIFDCRSNQESRAKPLPKDLTTGFRK